MGKPIGVAWLYEQLEGGVKRELGLEKQLAAAAARAAKAGNEAAAHQQDLWADIRYLRDQVRGSRKRAEAAEACISSLESALEAQNRAREEAVIATASLRASLVPLRRVAEAALEDGHHPNMAEHSGCEVCHALVALAAWDAAREQKENKDE